MPAFTIYNTASGAVLRSGYGPDEAFVEAQIKEGESAYLGTARFDQRIVNGEPVDALDLQMTAAMAEMKRLLEQLRSQLACAPITYEGVLLDADVTAQSNIKDKLSELGLRIVGGQGMPTELLVWRDYDNNMHTFVSMEELQAWLGGLLVAIADRGTRSYLWVWQKKALLAACTSLSEVQSIRTELMDNATDLNP